MKEVKVTPKMTMAIDALKALGGKAFAREILRYLDNTAADRAELKTFNSVNSTIAYAAKAGLVDKKPEVFEGKMLTQYSIAGADEATEVEVEEPEADEITEGDEEVTEPEDEEE
jgi:hypothetical protein